MASSYLVGARGDESSCMRYEIYAIREREEDGTAGGEEETMPDINDASPSTLLPAAARSHVANACSPIAQSHLWYRDSLFSTMRSSTEEEAPWRRKESAKKNLHASSSSAGAASTSSSTPTSSSLPPCLWGELDFGDAVDDEWGAAWMLLKATAGTFKVGRNSYRLAARCWDDDGDFLLIEAAEALPRWLSPLNSDNRCWLFGGRVHIIPRKWREQGGGKLEKRQAASGGGDRQPTLPEALEVLGHAARPSSPSSSPSASSPSPSPSPPEKPPSDAGPRIHAALIKRLGDLRRPPRALRRPPHAARALVPPRLAALLLSGKEPGLVSAAVDAFYRRDPRGLRAASRARWFPPMSASSSAAAASAASAAATTASSSSPPPPPAPASLVPLLVKTTRLQFAQLALQQYDPPRGWPVLPRAHKDAAAVEFGAKLAAGFEILMTAMRVPEGDGGERAPSSPPFPSPLPSDPLSLDALDPPGWKEFLKALEARGAFEGEVRGSARYQELRRQAAASFSSSSSTTTKQLKNAPSSPGGDDSSSPPAASSSSSTSSSSAAAALRAAEILKDLGEVLDVEALRARGEAAVVAEGESSAAWLRAASASSPSSGANGDGDDSDDGDEDEFLAAMAEAEARQAAEAERKQRKKKEKKETRKEGAVATSGGDDDDNDDEKEEKEKEEEDFDPASVVEKVKSFVEKMSSWEGAEAEAGAGASGATAVAATSAVENDEALFAGDRGSDGRVSLDESSFWDELGAALGVPTGGLGDILGAAVAGENEGEEDGGGGSSSDDEGSSFYSERSDDDDDGDGDDDDDDSSRLPRKLLEAEAARLRAQEVSGSRARRGAPPPEDETAGGGGGSRFAFPASAAAAAAAAAAAKPKKNGDEEDDDDFAFATAYEAELGRQLRGTTLGRTWGADGVEKDEDEGGGGEQEALPTSRAAKRAATSTTAVGGSSGIACLDFPSSSSNPLAPVDVDVNLLESLLASYAGEAGIPGPASTLAGMLGVSLPSPSSSASASRLPSAASASLAPATPSTSEKE